MNKAKLTGTILAVSAAAAFALVPVVSSAHADHHHKNECWGVNACKGKSSCKGSENACKGKNECKGKGWVKMSDKTCEQIGGKME